MGCLIEVPILLAVPILLLLGGYTAEWVLTLHFVFRQFLISCPLLWKIDCNDLNLNIYIIFNLITQIKSKYICMCTSLIQTSIIMVELFHLKTLSQQHIYVIVTPLCRRQVLQKQQSILEAHSFEILCKLQEEGSTNVTVKLWKAFFFRKICIPQADYLVNIKFSG